MGITPATVVKVGGLATRWAPRTPAAVVEEDDEPSTRWALGRTPAAVVMVGVFAGERS